MNIYKKGHIKGLYNLIFDNKEYIINILSDKFFLDYKDINISISYYDLSIIINAKLISSKDKYVLMKINRLDEYHYYINDINLFYKIINTAKNKKRLKKIMYIMKKSG